MDSFIRAEGRARSTSVRPKVNPDQIPVDRAFVADLDACLTIRNPGQRCVSDNEWGRRSPVLEIRVGDAFRRNPGSRKSGVRRMSGPNAEKRCALTPDRNACCTLRATHSWRSRIRPSIASALSPRPRSRQSVRVTRSLDARSRSKSIWRRAASARSMIARLTSSFRSNDRLSKFVDRTTDHRPSMTKSWRGSSRAGTRGSPRPPRSITVTPATRQPRDRMIVMNFPGVMTRTRTPRATAAISSRRALLSGKIRRVDVDGFSRGSKQRLEQDARG